MIKGNKEIDVLAAELEVDEALPPIQKEVISVKYSMNRYIDTLPFPEEEITLEEEKQQKEEEEEYEAQLEEQQEEVQEEIVQESEMPENMEVIVDENNELAKRVEGITPTVRSMNVSAYCACIKCCGKTDGETASQTQVKEWYTVAAGEGYEMGTIIYIPYLADKPNQGWFVVEDRGDAIDNSKLDIYFTTDEAAMEFGRHQLECYIYEF